jgi:hypothetical protein
MATMNRAQGSIDVSSTLPEKPYASGMKMTISTGTDVASSLSFGLRGLRGLLVAAALAGVTLPGAADARMAGAYDGVWNVVFATTRGNCSSGYRVPFTVSGGRVSSAGGGRVSGSVAGNGRVAVNVSVGASRASGGGRLAGNSGGGSWSGIISGDRCSGTWQASR